MVGTTPYRIFIACRFIVEFTVSIQWDKRLVLKLGYEHVYNCLEFPYVFFLRDYVLYFASVFNECLNFSFLVTSPYLFYFFTTVNSITLLKRLLLHRKYCKIFITRHFLLFKIVVPKIFYTS